MNSESFMAPATGDKSPMYKPFVANIKDVAVVDVRTVRFTLKTPSAAFEASTLAKINLIPKHVWEPILKDLAEKREYRPVIDSVYPLEQVVAATKYVETQQKTGNVVLSVSG